MYIYIYLTFRPDPQFFLNRPMIQSGEWWQRRPKRSAPEIANIGAFHNFMQFFRVSSRSTKLGKKKVGTTNKKWSQSIHVNSTECWKTFRRNRLDLVGLEMKALPFLCLYKLSVPCPIIHLRLSRRLSVGLSLLATQHFVEVQLLWGSKKWRKRVASRKAL